MLKVTELLPLPLRLPELIVIQFAWLAACQAHPLDVVRFMLPVPLAGPAFNSLEDSEYLHPDVTGSKLSV
jgi:hypothetical protein